MIDNIAKGTLKQWHLEDMDKISRDKSVVLPVSYTHLPEFYLPETESPEKRISKRYSSIKGTVSCHI